MDEPIQILIDELKTEGKSWEETEEIVAGLSEDEDRLNMAEWLYNHRDAGRQERLKELFRLIKKSAT